MNVCVQCESLNLKNISRPVTCCEQTSDLDLSDLKTDDQHELKKSFDCTQYKTQVSEIFVIFVY